MWTNASQTPARTVGPALTHLEASCAPADLDTVGWTVKQTSMTVLPVSGHVKDENYNILLLSNTTPDPCTFTWPDQSFPLSVPSDPCLSGGSCMDGVNSFHCSCLPGFTGPRCALEINECQSSPCKNGGTCTDYVNSYTCTCRPGFTGIHCETNIPDCTERWVYVCVCVWGLKYLNWPYLACS